MFALYCPSWYNAFMRYEKDNGITFCCAYHIVWCVKYRRNILTEDVGRRAEELIYAVCKEWNVKLQELRVNLDHIYMNVYASPKVAVHRLVKAVKRRTCGVLRAEFSDVRSRIPSLWTNNYFVSTEKKYPMVPIRKFLEAQRNI